MLFRHHPPRVRPSCRKRLGGLAREVKKTYPELVSTGADGYKAVNYAQLTPVLIKVLKAALALAAAAKTRAAQAIATLDTFKARLWQLEASGAQAPR